jgi:hypothetical protein
MFYPSATDSLNTAFQSLAYLSIDLLKADDRIVFGVGTLGVIMRSEDSVRA